MQTVGLAVIPASVHGENSLRAAGLTVERPPWPRLFHAGNGERGFAGKIDEAVILLIESGDWPVE